MFSAIKKVVSNIKKLDEGKILKEVLYGNDRLQDAILKLNTQVQLYEYGIDSQGRTLGNYAPFTVQYKQAKGDTYDHITLHDTGAFYESFKMKVTNDGFVIKANTIKKETGQRQKRTDTISGAGSYRVKTTTDLAEVYGEDILGLTEQSLSTVREWALPLARPIVLNKVLAR